MAAQAARMANDVRLEIARREFAQDDTGAEATRDGAVDRGMRAAQAYSEGLAPRQAPTLSASA